MSEKGSDKRSVSTDALETLGTCPLDEAQKRDAIHLAVEPVTAGEGLHAGQHVRVEKGVAFGVTRGDESALGIVDPFIPRRLKAGERFWFVMYPRKVTSLRHVWSHPAFADEPLIAPDPDVVVITRRKSESEEWLRAFVADSPISSYDVLIRAAIEGSAREPGEDYYGLTIEDGYVCTIGTSSGGDIPSEFWDHLEVVTGRKFTDRATYFSCSC